MTCTKRSTMISINEFTEEFHNYKRDMVELHRKGKVERRRLESAKMKRFFQFIEKVTVFAPKNTPMMPSSLRV